MKNIKRLDLDIDNIRKKLGIKDKRQATIPEMLYPKFKEPTISRWLSYLLNPEQNQYGCDILNILLEAFGVKKCDSKEYTIYNECFLGIDDNRNKDNYIDIYISTPEYIVGIEVKLNATETDDQTKRYHEVIKKQCEMEKKEAIEIYLRPDSNTCKPECTSFKIITFATFLKGLEEFSNTLHQHNRDHFLIDEFIMYLKEDPERARFVSALSNEEKDTLKYYHTQLYKDLKALLNINGYTADLKNGERHRETEGFGFLQFVRNGKECWKNDLNFHFELLWNDSHYLALHKKIILAAHLETPTKNENRNRIINFFKEQSANNRILFDRRTLYYEELEVDFTSHDGCCDSIKRIIELLNKHEYSQWSDIADRCIEELLK